MVCEFGGRGDEVMRAGTGRSGWGYVPGLLCPVNEGNMLSLTMLVMRAESIAWHHACLSRVRGAVPVALLHSWREHAHAIHRLRPQYRPACPSPHYEAQSKIVDGRWALGDRDRYTFHTAKHHTVHSPMQLLVTIIHSVSSGVLSTAPLHPPPGQTIQFRSQPYAQKTPSFLFYQRQIQRKHGK
jgi:hypothetical protein